MKNLLVIIDMVNGFAQDGALADKNIKRIVPSIIEKIKRAKANGDLIVAFRDCHDENDEEFKFYPKHCIKGSWESEIIDELKPYLKDSIIIDKNTTNGLKTKEFEALIKRFSFDNIEVTGCCSDICVRDFTHSLIKYFTQNKIDTIVKIDEQAIDTFNGQGHEADKINREVAKEFESLGVVVNFKNEKKKNKFIKAEKITDNKFLNLFKATFQAENGQKIYEIVTRRELPEIIEPTLKVDAVNIIPYQFVDGKMFVYLIKEFREPLNDYIFSIPAGLVEKGEASVDSATREVEEEIGARVKTIQRVETPAYTSAGMSDESIDFYEAEVSLAHDQHLDKFEDIKVVPVELDKLEYILNSRKFGAQGKLQLRAFLQRQKIKELEKKLKDLENEK